MSLIETRLREVSNRERGVQGGRGEEGDLEREGDPERLGGRRCSGTAILKSGGCPLRGAGCKGQVSLPLAVNLQYSL